MFIHVTCIDRSDHNVGMVCAKVTLRCSCIPLVLIYLITMEVWHVPKLTQMLMHTRSTCIDLFDHNVGMEWAKVRLRCPCISLLSIYLITMWVWHVPKLDLDVHGYHWYWFIWSNVVMAFKHSHSPLLSSYMEHEYSHMIHLNHIWVRSLREINLTAFLIF